MPRKAIEPEEDELRKDTLPEDELDLAAEEDAPESLGEMQQGGTRGSSNQGGPDRSGAPEKDSALKRNARSDQGSRSSLGRPDPLEGESPNAPKTAAPRGKLPPGTMPEDYLGGKKPHKTRARGRTRGASGVKNRVV